MDRRIRLFLVDGYNYAHRVGLIRPDGPPRRGELERAREALVRRLRPLTRDGAKLRLVWDARGAAADQPGGLAHPESTFARAETADELILAAVRRDLNAGRIGVVSDDRELAGRSRQLGAKAVAVDEVERWLGDAQATDERDGPRSAGAEAPSRSMKSGSGAPGEKPPPPTSKAEIAEWERIFSRGQPGDPDREV